LASRKVPLNPFFLTEATTDRKAASAISQTPQCCAQPFLPRARALSLFSLSRALSVSVETRDQFAFTLRFLRYILSRLRVFSHLRVVCLAVENCQVSFVGRKIFGTQIRGSSRVFSFFFFFLFFNFLISKIWRMFSQKLAKFVDLFKTRKEKINSQIHI